FSFPRRAWERERPNGPRFDSPGRQPRVATKRKRPAPTGRDSQCRNSIRPAKECRPLGVGLGMDKSKSPPIGFWCCVGASFLGLYFAADGILRLQDALIYDVRYWTAPNGVSYSNLGVTDNHYVDDRQPWHVWVGRPAERIFFHCARWRQ